MIYRVARDKKAAPAPVEVSSLKSQGWSEKDLENYLFKHLPRMVGTDLFVIGQSSPGNPEVDLLALDCEGDLWFFELKAVRSSSENLLQVLRYSQSYSGLSIDELSAIYERFTKDTRRSLAVAFCAYFGYSSPSAVQEWGERIGRRHHLLVVTDGADDETIGSVNHWQRHGLDIDIWPYRVYGQDGDAFHLELPEIYIKGRRISSSIPGVFLVNTNRRYFGNAAEEMMLEQEVALANEERWMRKINRITAGSKVLLYANGVGAIAIGVATPERRDGVIQGGPMRYVKLREFRRLRRPLTISEMNKARGGRAPVRHTVQELGGEGAERVWEAALSLAETKL